MPEVTDPRVAVYIDFDNIVISRYDQLHGKQAWRNDNARLATPGDRSESAAKLTSATVDVGAILDYASSFGTVALSRAYADWSVPANASYRRQLVDRAVDLTQLFTTTKAGKNGADIRLSVDVLEDLFRLPDLTHVVIVAGDSDYIALAQRCKRLGRFVVGIGVAGGTSPALIAACDDYEMYDAIPQGGDADTGDTDAVSSESESSVQEPTPTDPVASEATEEEATGKLSDRAASRLLVRALELGHAKDDDEWLHAATVKSQIKRLDPSFNEKLLGFSTFTDFVSSRGNLAEVKIDGNQRYVRLRADKPSRAEKPSKAEERPAKETSAGAAAEKPARGTRRSRKSTEAASTADAEPAGETGAEPAGAGAEPAGAGAEPAAEPAAEQSTPDAPEAVAAREKKPTRAPRRASSSSTSTG